MLAFLVVYHANGRPHPEVDCIAAPYTAWSLVRHGSLDLRRYPCLAARLNAGINELPDGSWGSRYPPGSTLAMLPFVAPLAIVREEPLTGPHMEILGKLAAACFVAAAAGLFFLLCKEVAPSACWPATLLFGLGTCLCSVASQAIWMHGPATFWVCLALWLLLRGGELTPGRCLAAGLALSLAVATRPTTALVAAATAATLALHGRWRLVTLLALGGAFPVLFTCLWNWRQFGHPLLGGYSGEYWNKPPPLWVGLGGLLIAPSRGVLVYSPALLLVPFGAVVLWRPIEHGRLCRDLLLAWLAAAAVTLVYYARWCAWAGGWCYGPRFLCEMMPALCLVFAVGYCHLQARWQRSAAVALVALSVVVHVVGLLGYPGYHAWCARHELPDEGRCLFELRDTQIEAHARSCFRQFLARASLRF
jgi:hypothetical protein